MTIFDSEMIFFGLDWEEITFVWARTFWGNE